MKIFLKILLAFSISVSFIAQADTTRFDINIGGVDISIDSPEDFHEITSVSPEMKFLMESFTPKVNRLLGGFVTEEDLGRSLKRQEVELQRYMLLQTNRQLENVSVSSADFQQLSALLKEQQATLLEDNRALLDELVEGAENDLSDEYGVSVNLEIGQQVPLGVFYDKPYAISLAYLGKYQATANGETYDYVLAQSISYVVVKQKLLYAYVYSAFEDQDDVDWVRSKTIRWIEQMRQ